MHRMFRPGVWEYRLERITAGMVPVPMCVVSRTGWGEIYETYMVQMLTSGLGQALIVKGTWGRDFVFSLDGSEACRVKHLWSDAYNVTVQPQRDVLLFLGIACAIDHIEHEIQQAKREREALERQARERREAAERGFD